MVGLPLLVDLPLGTLRAFPGDLQLLLPPLKSEEEPYALAPDDEILAVFHRERINLCDPFRDGGPLREARDRVLVTSGPLPGHHDVLGPVDAGVSGFDKTSFVFYHGIGMGRRVFRKATPTQMNTILASWAILKYGTAVDGVINVNYESDPANDVFATGLAVRAVDTRVRRSGAELSLKRRLQRMNELLEDGFITPDEYHRKRDKLLNEL